MADWQNEEKKLQTVTPSVQEVKNHQLTAVKGGGGLSRRLYYGMAAAASIALLFGVALWIFTKPKPIGDIVLNPIDTLARLPLPTPFPKSDKENAPIAIDINKKPIDTKIETKPESPKSNPSPIKPPVVAEKTETPTHPIEETSNSSYLAMAETAYKEDIPDYESMTATRGNNNSGGILEEAGKAYESKDFNKVLNLLKNTPISADNFSALELLAHAEFQLKHYKAALPMFQNLLKLSGKRTQDRSEWYLLLCYLANYNQYQNEFKVLAQKISTTDGHDYKEQAANLLNKMR
jgi:tetratricopeptide (TPR) repeat protein